MKRRALLGAVAGVGTLAGCLDTGGSGGGGGVTSLEDGTAAAGTRSTAPNGVSLPVPEEELHRGASKDGIPAIVDPSFDADWSAVRWELVDDDDVIGVERDGAARAYPLRVLNWHEVVNERFGGPLLVTYCPLCGSGVTATRRVGGEPTVFGVSGLLWNSDLVMYDRKTESLWSQILATAIRGPETGTSLEFVPSTITTWDEWRAAHPETDVLVPPPKSRAIGDAPPRDYSLDPYAMYADSSRVGIGHNEFDDDRMHPKTTVVGVVHDGVARAYPLPAVVEAGVINDVVAGLPVVVATDASGSLAAYVRTVDGETLSFEAAGDGELSGGGSTWRVATGHALDGPHEGTTLDRATVQSPMFWFAWADFHPDTEVYGAGGTTG